MKFKSDWPRARCRVRFLVPVLLQRGVIYVYYEYNNIGRRT